MPADPQTFGRRGTAPIKTGPAPTAAPTPAPSDLSPAAQALLRDIAAAPKSETRPRMVPRSLRATLLAGLVVGLVQAGLAARQGPAPDLLAEALGGGGLAAAALPLALLSGLAGGVSNAFGTLALVRWFLNRIGRTGTIDYAVGGAGLALAYALAVRALGLGGVGPELPLDVGLGAAAGFLYRLFAGTVLRPAA